MRSEAAAGSACSRRNSDRGAAISSACRKRFVGTCPTVAFNLWRSEMRIVKRYRALFRIYGIASCALLACGEAAHAKQTGDRNGDIAAHQAIHNKKTTPIWQGAARYTSSGRGRSKKTS